MEAENPLSGLGAAWDAAHASLAAAVDALDPEWVNAAAHKWVDCAIRFVNAVPLDGTTNTGGVGPSEDNAERIWGGGMCRLSVFGVRLCCTSGYVRSPAAVALARSPRFFWLHSGGV